MSDIKITTAAGVELLSLCNKKVYTVSDALQLLDSSKKYILLANKKQLSKTDIIPADCGDIIAISFNCFKNKWLPDRSIRLYNLYNNELTICSESEDSGDISIHVTICNIITNEIHNRVIHKYNDNDNDSVGYYLQCSPDSNLIHHVAYYQDGYQYLKYCYNVKTNEYYDFHTDDYNLNIRNQTLDGMYLRFGSSDKIYSIIDNGYVDNDDIKEKDFISQNNILAIYIPDLCIDVKLPDRVSEHKFDLDYVSDHLYYDYISYDIHYKYKNDHDYYICMYNKLLEKHAIIKTEKCIGYYCICRDNLYIVIGHHSNIKGYTIWIDYFI